MTSRLDQKPKVLAFSEIASFYGRFKSTNGVIRRAQGCEDGIFYGYLSVGLRRVSMVRSCLAQKIFQIFPSPYEDASISMSESRVLEIFSTSTSTYCFPMLYSLALSAQTLTELWLRKQEEVDGNIT